MKHALFTSILALSLQTTAISNTIAHPQHEVTLHGDLRLISKNKLTETRPLEGYKISETFYGIGMPEGLNQEVIVLGGKTYIGKFSNLKYKAHKTNNLNLVFFASAHIPKWQKVIIPKDIKTFSAFQTYLANTAKTKGLDTKKGFMFRLEAEMESLKWFIVSGMGNLKPSALKSFLRQRILGGLESRKIEALGTYSEKLRGVASAPSTPMHMHFITIDEGKFFVGHIDNDFLIKSNATLYLPITPKRSKP